MLRLKSNNSSLKLAIQWGFWIIISRIEDKARKLTINSWRRRTRVTSMNYKYFKIARVLWTKKGIRYMSKISLLATLIKTEPIWRQIRTRINKISTLPFPSLRINSKIKGSREYLAFQVVLKTGARLISTIRWIQRPGYPCHLLKGDKFQII